MQKLASVLAVGLLGGWSRLAAQISPPPAATVDETVIVTASLEPASPRDLPAAVEVIESAEIERRQSDQVIDLLRTVPGVGVVRSGSPGKVASLFLRGASSNQTLVLWNGVELNDPAFGAFDGSTLSTDGLDRVEVARGPFSAVWGSSAMGGVIQLLTRRDGGSTYSARLEAGSNELRRAAARARLVGERATLDLGGHVRRGEGELDNDFFDGDEQDLAVDLFPSAAGRIGVMARRAASRIGVPFDYLGQPSPGQHQSFESTLVALPVGWTFRSWSLEGAASRHSSDLRIEDRDDPFAASRTESARDALRATARIALGENGSIALGGSGEQEEATTSSAFGTGLDGDRQRSRALFGEVGWGRGILRGSLGLRRDESDTFGGATSLRGGVVAALGERSRLRASYGESFRAPSLGDLFYPGFSNPDLEPERGRSWELGLEQRVGALSWSATGFRNDFDGLILYDFASGRPENVGRARSRGIELAAALRASIWEGRLSATWLDGEERPSGRPLPRRAKRSAQLLVSRDAGSWNGGAILRYVGERTDVGDARLPGYLALDLAATLSMGEGVAIFARVDNALDRTYQEAAGYPAPGRAYRVGLTLRRLWSRR